jgi:hypothetical protein
MTEDESKRHNATVQTVSSAPNIARVCMINMGYHIHAGQRHKSISIGDRIPKRILNKNVWKDWNEFMCQRKAIVGRFLRTWN